jgi:hypothetical protein
MVAHSNEKIHRIDEYSVGLGKFRDPRLKEIKPAAELSLSRNILSRDNDCISHTRSSPSNMQMLLTPIDVMNKSTLIATVCAKRLTCIPSTEKHLLDAAWQSATDHKTRVFSLLSRIN